MTEFTRGKWEAVKHLYNHSFDVMNAHSGERIAYLNQGKANAHLMASAPDMYAMLEELSDCFGQKDCSWSVSKGIEIDKLLAKARGEG